MGLETGTFTDDLVITNPPGGDDKRQGDDHLRLIKTTLRNTIKRGSKAFYLPGVAAKTANYTVLDTDENLTIVCDTTAGAFTLTLPTLDVTRYGWKVRVIKTNAGVNPVFIQPSSGTINGYAKVRRSIESAPTEIEWIGSWVASRPNGGAPVGSVVEYYGTTLPRGHLWADGSGFTAADYVELNTAFGVATTPDRRGRAACGRDDMGGSAAGRVTSAASGIDGLTLKASGGTQTVTLDLTMVPAHAHSVSVSGGGSGATDSQGLHAHTGGSLSPTVTAGGATALSVVSGSGANLLNPTAGVSFYNTAGFTTTVAGAPWSGQTDFGGSHAHNVSVSISGSGGTDSMGGGLAHLNMSPSIICNAIVVAE